MLLEEILDGEHSLIDHQELIVILIDGIARTINHVCEQFLGNKTAAETRCHSEKDFAGLKIVIETSVCEFIGRLASRYRSIDSLFFTERKRQLRHHSYQLPLGIDINHKFHRDIIPADNEMNNEIFRVLIIFPISVIESFAKGLKNRNCIFVFLLKEYIFYIYYSFYVVLPSFLLLNR